MSTSDIKVTSNKSSSQTNAEAMTFFDHLNELRVRLVRIVLVLLPTTLVAWVFKQQLLDLLVEPLVYSYQQLGLGDPKLHFSGPIDPIVGYLKISFVTGVIISSPWIFWQVWRFVSPGLYRREKVFAIPFVFASTLFFVGGTLFGYFLVFPSAFEMFLGFSGLLPSGNLHVTPTIMLNEYLAFSTRLLLAFGVVFEVPVAITFLAAAGIVHWKQLLKFSRWWVLIAAFISAFLTPPDWASQLLMLGPLVVLYFVAILFAMIVGPKDNRKGQKHEDK